MEVYQILIIVAILFLILEIFIPSFIAGSLTVGFLFAALGAYLEFDIKWQIILFSSGVLITFFGIRPIMLKYGYRSGNKIKTNQEALIGRTAKVVETINNQENIGRVSIDGDVWRSKSIDNSIIEIGTSVKVIQISSIILIVKPLRK